MLRSEMRAGIQRIIEDLRGSGISAFFSAATNSAQARSPVEDISVLFKMDASFYSKTESYGAVERQLLEIFELGFLLQEKYWQTIGTGEEGRHEVYIGARQVSTFEEFNPKILELLAGPAPERAKAHDTDADEGNAEIQIHLADTGHGLSKATRVIEAISGLNGLYGAVCQIESIDDKELIIANCDSGSALLFTFLGVGEAITALKEVMFELWDRVVFFKSRRLGNNLETVVQSLSVLEKVKTAMDNRSCGPEEGELLKRTIISGATKLLDSGAVLPEFEQRSHVNVKEIMAPAPRMLTAPSGEIDQDVDGKIQQPIGESQDGELTARDEGLIQETVRRIKAEQAEQAEEDQDTGQVKKKREKRPPKK